MNQSWKSFIEALDEQEEEDRLRGRGRYAEPLSSRSRTSVIIVVGCIVLVLCAFLYFMCTCL